MLQYRGGDGLSKEKAIIILANNEMEGVDAEYNWLEEKFGQQNINWELNDQGLLDDGNKQYDILRIKFRSGNVKEFWFEITNFCTK